MRHNGVNWTDAGVGSRSGGGVSNTYGTATIPRLQSNGGQLHLVWLDQLVSRSGDYLADIYAKFWDGSEFLEDLAGDAQNEGVEPGAAVPTTIALAVGPTGSPVVVWEDVRGAQSAVYLRANLQPASQSGTVVVADANNAQQMLDANDLGPGDMLLLQGSHSGFTVSAGDAGVTIVGAPASIVSR